MPRVRSKMTDARIVVVGSCMIDLSCFAERIPKPGETIIGDSFNIGHGGKGANQAVAASKLGANVTFIARLGDDYFGKEYLKSFEDVKIDTKFIKLIEGQPSGVAQITVSKCGENQIVIIPGANNFLKKEDVSAASVIIKSAKVVVCQLETDVDLVTESAKILKQNSENGLLILNAAPAKSDLPDEVLKCCDILCVNETEATAILNEELVTVADAERAVSKLIEKGCKAVIVTLGSQGAVYGDKKSAGTIHALAPKVDAVDTTGAGDSFIGALAFYLANKPELPMLEILKRSCDIAAISVQKKGTQASFPFKNELDEKFFK
ncbi:ribokinase-like [Cloeon dipterum]|uniref:ribokinase-like n=1 Tax=Cloeon dipterum TaxID=197152 RepID=UPI0032205CF1